LRFTVVLFESYVNPTICRKKTLRAQTQEDKAENMLKT